MDVFPLAQAAHIDKVLPQQLLVLPVAQLVGAADLGFVATRSGNPFPQLEVAGKLAFLVVKLGVRLVGLGLGVDGPVAHVLHAECRGDDQHFVQGFALTGLQNHAAHAWIERQARQFLAQRRERVGLVHCAEFEQQLVAIGNRPARGAF